MTKISLKVDKRTELGKKVKKLRREGFLPLNLYGKDFNSLALTAKFGEFQKIYRLAHNTQVVYLEIAKEEVPALIQHVQFNPVRREIIHADLKKIDLKQKTQVEVPVETEGELGVVKSGEADLILLHSKVLVECLPTKIPEKILVDISKLEGVGAEVKVKDLPQSADYSYQLDPEITVIQISAAQKEEIPVAAPEVEAPAEGAAPTEEAAPAKTEEEK